MTTLNVSQFRINFPPYADETTYPDSLLNTQYTIGKCYMEDSSCVAGDPDCLEHMFDLMLAHLMYIRDEVNAGNNVGVVTAANEGDVSVTLAQPPVNDEFHYWYNSSPYGRQLIVLLEANAIGGTFVGGLPERKGFRKFAGGF